MKKFLLVFIISALFPVSVFAQEPEETGNAFQGTRLVNSQSVNLPDKGELLLLIQHRFGDISGGFYDLFGLDYASMRFGFEYGITDKINLGIGRSTWLKTFDGFVKVGIVEQSADFPFTATATAGGSLPTIRDYFPDEFDQFSDKVSWNAQLHLAKTMDKLGIQLSPGYLKSGYLPDPGQNFSFFTLGMGAAFRFTKKVSANVEYLLPFDDRIPGKNALSFDVNIDTGGHLFQLLVSNNQRMFDQAIYTNTTGEWKGNHLYFGFNLIREFKLKYQY